VEKKFLNSTGQTIMEYIIVSSLIGIVSLFTIKKFGEVVEDRVSKIKEQIVKAIPL
jgi:hypothetical protein